MQRIERVTCRMGVGVVSDVIALIMICRRMRSQQLNSTIAVTFYWQIVFLLVPIVSHSLAHEVRSAVVHARTYAV